MIFDAQTKAIQRLGMVMSIIKDWASLSGHDRCWHHPEILHEIAAVLGIKVEPTPLPPRAEFEAGCTKYADVLFGPVEET